MKAFKLLLDYDLMEVLIPKQYKTVYFQDKTGFDNKTFNLFLISHFLAMNGGFVFSKNEREYVSTNLLYLPFDDLSNFSQLDEYKNSNFFIVAAYKYCRNNDCNSNVLKEISAQDLKISID